MEGWGNAAKTADARALGWTAHDTKWVLGLFGTAVGAGILFLPINAGAGGFWPLVIMTILIGPMTYLSHRALARFVCSSSISGSDITQVVVEHFGAGAGKAITLLYFLAIYPIVLIYGVGITNTVDSFMVNQLGMAPVPRWLLSGVLITAMMAVMLAGQEVMLRVTEWLVYPLAAILVLLSLYLIPSWDLSSLTQFGSPGSMLSTIWLTIPVLVFSFNHSPAISQFAVSLKRDYGNNASEKADVILRNTAAALLGFVMLFVFSCVLSLGPAHLAEAKVQNLPVLSYLANVHGSRFIAYFGPIIAFLAIVTSFFGHYLGAAEGLRGIVRNQFDPDQTRFSDSTLVKGIAVFIYLTTWGVAIANPSILGLIEMLAGPVIAAILYLMPMYAIHKVPALVRYRGQLSNVFVTLMGIVAISAIFYGILG